MRDEISIQSIRENFLERGRKVEAIPMLVSIKTDAAAELLLEFLERNQSQFVRKRIYQALGKIGSITAVQPLIQQFEKEEKYDLQWEIANTLSKLGSPTAKEFIYKIACAELPIPKMVGLSALRNIRTDRSYQFLEDAIEDDRNGIQSTAIGSLGELGGAQAVDILVNALDQFIEDAYLEMVTRNLGKLGDPRAVIPLITLLLRADNSSKRHTYGLIPIIRDALVKIDDPQTVDLLLIHLYDEHYNINPHVVFVLSYLADHRIVASFIDAFELELDRTVQINLINGLGKVADPRALDPLLEILKTAQNQQVRNATIVALGKVGDSSAIEPLQQRLQLSTDRYEGNYIIRALSQIGNTAAIDILISCLNHPLPDCRAELALQLGKLKVSEAVEKLIELCADDEKIFYTPTNQSSVGHYAITALGDIGDQRAIPTLLPFVNLPASDARQSLSVDALGQIGDPVVIPLLIDLLHDMRLQDRRFGIRYDVVLALVRIGTEQAFEPLIDLLENGAVRIRRTIVEILGQVAHPKAADMLLNMLHDSDNRVRWIAAQSLSKSEDERVTDIMIQLLQDETLTMRRIAVIALGKRQDQNAIDALQAATNDPNLLIRKAVKIALEQWESAKKQ